MGGWTRHQGLAIALPMENIDTDQLIPARFMSTPREAGYGGFLLHDLRFDADGAPDPTFPLNRAPEVSILLAGRNFGSGSSREAAVYALADFGVRVVIAPSFGDIFAANAVNNGLAPARVDPAVAEALTARLAGAPAPGAVDLQSGALEIAGVTAAFALDPVWREKLIQGWDDIDLTGAHAAEIRAFRARRAEAQPWAFPPPTRAG